MFGAHRKLQYPSLRGISYVLKWEKYIQKILIIVFLYMSQPPKSILVIDDNEDMLVMVSLVLRKNGYIVTGRSRFDNLEHELNAIAPNLILIDRTLGWIDGCQLCKQIRELPGFSSTIILIFSAYSISMEDCLEVGANGYLEKPFDIETFLKRLEEHLLV